MVLGDTALDEVFALRVYMEGTAMSRRHTPLDKAIKAIDDEITGLAIAREALIKQRDKADLEAARPPKLKTVAK